MPGTLDRLLGQEIMTHQFDGRIDAIYAVDDDRKILNDELLAND